VGERFPEDLDIAVLYAEALMDLSPWNYWADGGKTAKGRTGDIVGTLERVLAGSPEHLGAIHFYIHAVEASNRPERAEPFADRLANQQLGAGHLVHMPSHIYFRLGRYRDALKINKAAVAADEAYLARVQAEGIYPGGYYPHNIHFLLVSAQMAGDGPTAINAAEKLERTVTVQSALALPSFVQPSRRRQEARDRKVEAAPKEMRRARLTEKAGAEIREHVVAGEQHAMGFAIVAGVSVVIGEAHRTRDLVWHLMDSHIDAERAQARHHLGIEARDRRGPQCNLPELAIARAQPQHVVDEVELVAFHAAGYAITRSELMSEGAQILEGLGGIDQLGEPSFDHAPVDLLHLDGTPGNADDRVEHHEARPVRGEGALGSRVDGEGQHPVGPPLDHCRIRQRLGPVAHPTIIADPESVRVGIDPDICDLRPIGPPVAVAHKVRDRAQHLSPVYRM
jgi:hypothetical protein